jgi:hypothetical protein
MNPSKILGYPGGLNGLDAVELFSNYLRVTGVAHTGPEPQGDAQLIGKRLGLLNGSSWITLWANFFGHMYLPGVHLVNIGNEAIQINFMEAHLAGIEGLPAENAAAFQRYALDCVNLAHVDAILITCSTMNRAYYSVSEALRPYNIPVHQIDRPMMEHAIDHGGPILVVATHGPTVTSTQALLNETSQARGLRVESSCLLVEEAWEALANNDVAEHNERLAKAIRNATRTVDFGCVVLAQLSMTALLLSYPDPQAEFGVPVMTSGQCGFEYMRGVLASKA